MPEAHTKVKTELGQADTSTGSIISSKEPTPRHGWDFLTTMHGSSRRMINKWKYWEEVCQFPSIFSLLHIT